MQNLARDAPFEGKHETGPTGKERSCADTRRRRSLLLARKNNGVPLWLGRGSFHGFRIFRASFGYGLGVGGSNVHVK